MWGKSINRRNIALVALTTSTAAMALAGPAQAQTMAKPIPTRAASTDMVKTRLLKLKDLDGNKPDDVRVHCLRTATEAGRTCTVRVDYPELQCSDSTVIATYRMTTAGPTPLVTGLKLRCIRTIDLQDADDAGEAAPAPAQATPAPAEQPAPPVQQTPAPTETDEQRAAREREEELRAIEQAMLQEELGRR